MLNFKFTQKIKISLALAVFGSLPSLLCAAEEHGSSVHEIDWVHDLGFPWINFLILVTLLFFLLKKPASEFFLTRSKQIAKEIEQSAQEKQEAESFYLTYDRRLQNIESEMQKLVSDMKVEGELARNRLIEEAQDSARRIQEVAQWVADHEIKKARETLKKEISALVVSNAETLIRTHITSQDQQRLAQENLQKMESYL